ncbi:hypothetical protein [Methylobacterium platani]|uniref:Uncharacterized protein n=1 Tax=Methylobacterium platani TaxID=427683 RepID=A0A179S9B4_9HYPH|nr:hypothetical protein [Methylobacterium platani]OAS23957.1 hypothetical protein A5481_16045 [Methylobacterium platani]
MAYLAVLCPGRPPDGWAPDEQVGYDAVLAGLLASACAIRDGLKASTCDLAVVRTQVETLRAEAASYAAKLDAHPTDFGDDFAERAITGTVRLAQIADVCLATCGDRAALKRLAKAAETCTALYASGYMPFFVGARQLLAMPEGLGEWCPGRPPIPVLGTALQIGRNALARHEDKAGDGKARSTHAEATDDDRAGLSRHSSSAPEPKQVTAEPAREAAPALSLRVFPSLQHLPLPSQMSRDRGDSPRALCEPIAEVPLPLTPAPDPAAVASMLNAAFPWAREVTEQYAGDLVGAPFAMLKPRTLVGGAGEGKTSYARALLRAVGLPEVLYSAAGVMDGGNFAGASRTWSTWRLSVPAQGVLRFRMASLGCVIDEAEKAGPSRRWGRLDETLLPFLERGSTAKAIFDPALEVPLDLSGVSYILTANTRDGVSGPLLDRAPPVQWPMSRREDLPVVAAAILDELRRERGLDEAWCPPLDGDELDALSAWRGGSLRPLRRMVEAVVAAREVFARQMAH